MLMLLYFDVFQFSSLVLVLVLLFLAYKLFESKWSYRISKPNRWESAQVAGNLSKELRKIERSYRDKVRFYNFWFQVERLKRLKIKGDFAEVGVYQGETAWMLHQMDQDRTLHLFDTFEGFNQQDLDRESSKDERYTTANFSDTQLSKVQELFTDSPKVNFYPGYFPATTAELKPSTFALVHLDADLYKPTIDSLQFFYPLLAPGGVIIVHDYNHTWQGVQEAIDEFAATISECFVELTDWQGSAILIKNKR